MTVAAQAMFVDRTSCINCGSESLEELSHGLFTDEPLRGFIAADPWGTDPLQFLQTAEWKLVKCSDCSQAFRKHILNEEWNERRFSDWMNADAILEFEKRIGADAPEQRFQKAVQQIKHILRLEVLTRHLTNGKPVRLLDFGCGWGDFIGACQSFGFETVGVDRSTARQSGAKVRIEPSLDVVDGQFHVATLFETLEHLDEPASVLQTIYPRIIEGGFLVLETPDCTDVTTIASHTDYLRIHPLEHINAFTHQTLKSIAKRCGFENIPRPVAHVTTELSRIARSEVKFLVGKGERSTQLYFRKIG